MKKVAWTLLLTAANLAAQSNPVPAGVVVPVKPVFVDPTKPTIQSNAPTTICVIPLVKFPIPAGTNFTLQKVTPPEVDFKIVVKPPMSPCPDKAAVPALPVPPKPAPPTK